MDQQVRELYDVVVIGGGAAGLNGALVLSRARRSVLVVDDGRPRNAPAEGVHGFLSRDGMPPGDLLAAGRDEVRSYGGELVDTRVVSATRERAGFVVSLLDGRSVRARRLLITTGLVDELPDVPGLRERWGRDVLHCPYCHGYEVRDRAIGVLGTDARNVHQTLLMGQWSTNVTLFLHTGPEPTDSEWEQLAARGVAVVDGEVVGLEVDVDRLSGVRMSPGAVVACQALVVAPRFTARDELAGSLGLECTAAGPSTSIATEDGVHAGPGVWVAGNVADPMAQVIQAAAGGNRAAIAINADLVAEDVQRLVEVRRNPFSAESERDVCRRVIGDRRHGVRL